MTVLGVKTPEGGNPPPLLVRVLETPEPSNALTLREGSIVVGMSGRSRALRSLPLAEDSHRV